MGPEDSSGPRSAGPVPERQDVTIADLNGDGWQDIFISQYNDQAWAWLNDGKGGLKATGGDIIPSL